MTFPVAYKWRFDGMEYVPVIYDAQGREVTGIVWAAQPGSQAAFLAATETEVIFVGTRAGCGKSDALLMSYLQHVDKWGAAWRGIILRQTHPMLKEMTDRSKRWIPRIWPGAQYNEIKYRWEFPNGAQLHLGHLAEQSDFITYQGNEYTFIGFEELVTWPNLDLYKLMFSVLRSPIPNIPKMIRSTTNPYGPSHNLIKTRFNLPIPNAKSMANPDGSFVGRMIPGAVDKNGLREPDRRAIHGHILENKLLLNSDPHYIDRLKGSIKSEDLERAWIDGDWDITAGGLLDLVWNKAKRYAVLVGLTPETIPVDWSIFRSFDWGYSAPFVVQWFARSNGNDLTLADGKVISTRRDDLFLVKEWYGSTGQPNEGLQMLAPEIAKGIIDREVKWGWRPLGARGRVKPGPADTMIFDDVNGICIATEFEKMVVVDGQNYKGILWEHADKGPNSRAMGWDQLRQRLHATIPVIGGRERAALFISPDCHDWLRTVPVLPRDEKNMEDCPKNCEDHCFVAGTMVDTSDGPVAIEKLPALGWLHSVDRIEPYYSPRLTRRAAQLVRLTFSSGRSATCTPDHKFLVDFDEWCYAKDLNGREILCSQSLSAERSRNLKESATTSVANIFSAKGSDFIFACGSTTTGLYRRAIIFITSTLVPKMDQTILSASPILSTAAIGTGASLVKEGGNIFRSLGLLPLLGTGPMRVANGIRSILKNSCASASQIGYRLVASIAGPPSSRPATPVALQNSATQIAKRVRCVGVESLQERRDVYCLTVPTNHTFSIEDGILVANCGDCTRYALRFEYFETRPIGGVRM